MLIEPLGPQIQIAAKARPPAFQYHLQFQCPAQIVLPVGVAQTALVGAHHQHQLGRLLSVQGDGVAHRCAVGIGTGVPMDVNDHLNGRVLLHPLFNLFQCGIISPVIAGIVVERCVVEHGDSPRFQSLSQDPPHPYHGVFRVLGAGGFVFVVFPSGLHGVGLRSVGMDNEHRGAVLIKIQNAFPLQQFPRVHVIGAGPADGNGRRVRLGKHQLVPFQGWRDRRFLLCRFRCLLLRFLCWLRRCRRHGGRRYRRRQPRFQGAGGPVLHPQRHHQPQGQGHGEHGRRPAADPQFVALHGNPSL